MITNDPMIMGYIEYLKSQGKKPWVGFDFDGTIAVLNPRSDEGWPEIGKPIIKTINHMYYCKNVLKLGIKIFTARVSKGNKCVEEVYDWLEKFKNLFEPLMPLELTNIKDDLCVGIIDDIAYRVERNTGRII